MKLFNTNKYTRELIRKSSKYDCILLESQSRDHPSSVISYFASMPSRTISGKGDKITIFEKGSRKTIKSNPWQALKTFRKRSRNRIFGYLGYDLKNFSSQKPLVSENPELIETPDFYFMEPDFLVEFDETGVIRELGSLAEIGSDLENKDEDDSQHLNADLAAGIEFSEFIRNVEEIKRRIMEGDFYELNYSYPILGKFEGDAYNLYEQMRKINPVPFGAFMKIGPISVCSASPERFLKKEENRVISEPIKGTTARYDDPQLDLIQKEILVNEKNRAENLMIVDLVRHDLSRLAKTGSVNVVRLFDIQTFGTVHQLISTVEAETDYDTDPVDLIQSCFPMGSMTGAPKLKVMQAIEELECYRRGIYSGAIGSIDADGNFDFNVVIRTAIIRDEKLVYPAGGAITGDSDPVDEWKETRIKAKVLTEVFSKNGIRTK